MSISPSPLPTATPAPTAVSTRSATEQPGLRTIVLTPRPNDVGWWGSGFDAGNIGDSFLYAGFYQDQVFISAMRFDLRTLPRGAPVEEAVLQLAGLREDRLAQVSGGAWSVQMLADAELGDLSRATFQTVFNAPAKVTLFPVLQVTDLGQDKTNSLSMDASGRQWLAQQVVSGTTTLVVRIVGPAGGRDTLFAWDSGAGTVSSGTGPQLRLRIGTPPSTPPPFPTKPVIIATLTPTPENIVTAAAMALTARAQQANAASSTPVAYEIITPTPDRLPPIVTETPTPANEATARAYADYATAVAITTGTFTPVPTDAITPMVVEPTPAPENVLTAVAQFYAYATQVVVQGTPTLLPYGVIVATVTPGPIVATLTPTAANAATSAAWSAYATAVAVTTGTFTPVPRVMTPTPVPVEIVPEAPLLLYLDDLALTPTVTTTPGRPVTVPRALAGKILFYSDRDDGITVMALDIPSNRLALVTQDWLYSLAKAANARSPDGQFRAAVQDNEQGVPQVYVLDLISNNRRKLTDLPSLSYDPAWSPRGNRIAFISQASGKAELYVINADGSGLRRLTTNTSAADRHPSWSPDGQQIVFSSDREFGRSQIWIINADGGDLRRLVDSQGNDWEPVWVK